MSSFDKVVKGACKPKAAPPKSKVCLTAQPSLARVLVTDSEPQCPPSTWTPSSLLLIPKTAQYTTCVRPLRRNLRNQTRLSVSTTEIASIYPTLTGTLTYHPEFHQVVFKALLTLHTIVRNGATDNILAYLSNGDILKLRNVSAPNWEGAPLLLRSPALR